MRYTVLKATGELYSYSALQLFSLLIMQSHWISWASLILEMSSKAQIITAAEYKCRGERRGFPDPRE